MNLLGLFLNAISFLPFWVLHRFSDVTYFGIYHVLGYRKKVVWENLKGSFPEKTDQEILQIQKKFYQNFCDLIFESIKGFTISKEEVLERSRFENPELIDQLFLENKNGIGISSHMGNWEWLALSGPLTLKSDIFVLYKPLANKKINHLVVNSRERFGARFIKIKSLRSTLDQQHLRPFYFAVLSDQAPHDYAKAFELPFLNRSTFFVAGPGLLYVQRNLTPVFGWIRRVGRSRYISHFELFEDPIPQMKNLSEVEQEQVRKFSVAHQLSESDSVKAFAVTKKFAQRLEEEIKMAPQDWLWSHRRWKTR